MNAVHSPPWCTELVTLVMIVTCAVAVSAEVPCSQDSDCTTGDFVGTTPPGNCERVWCNMEKGQCARSYHDSTTICRRARGVCDKAEWCTGDDGHCPPDEKSTAVCRFRNGPCDQREYCDGVGDHCPDDALAPPTTVCRPAADDCDAPELCTGSSLRCPTDRGVLSPRCEQEARAKCSNSCGCPSRQSCEAVVFRCSWAEEGCRLRRDAATEPNGTETEASRRLGFIMQRYNSIANHGDMVRGDEFLPHYGVTVLGTISDSDLELWANPVYELIKDEPEVTDHLVLLPPRSYHVSVRDLVPFLGRSSSVERTSQLLATFRDTQTELNRIFKGEPVVMRPDGSFRGGIWYFQSANHSVEVKMREAEGLMPGFLGVAEADSHRHWHMVFAYPRDRWRESHHSLKAQRKINSIIEKWGKMPQNITFNPPTVLTYEDITLFTPL